MQYTMMGNVTEPVDEINKIPDTVTESDYLLVVDDDQAILSVIMLLLETENYAGLGFWDSQKVIPFLEYVGPARKPAVILLDLMMPGVSGYEIAAWLSRNKEFSDIPVIVMTADHRIREAGAVPGATDWMRKPFQVDTLITKLESYLSHGVISS